uniref:alpha-amylase family glycosyl hydrolase n=1 Tax=Anaerococcus provencensis TaxID=938293 RepID=UPI0002EC28F6|nr:alpha-amylase family glycosyl hydrolase [Anaerococcus provencensis]
MVNLGKKVIYQIYPKSFKDTKDTGIGDLNGIKSKAKYLNDLGIDMVWISPFFVSPQNDNGYDIADYYTVDPMFGNNDDLYSLIEDLNKYGIDVMLDMVLNHTSTQHEWFKKALAGDKKYQDYYYIVDGKNGNPSNNWESVFKGPAWHKFADTDKYYLALFEKTQADLNWHNEDLRNELFDMVNFWLDKGVKGFRFDVLNMIGKSSNYSDWTDWSENKKQFSYYTDTPVVHDFIKELSAKTYGKYGDIITVGEMGNVDCNNALKYTDTGDELSMIFAFDQLDDGENKAKWTLTRYNLDVTRRNLFTWQEKMQEGNGWLGLFWNNHDNPRSISRFGDPEKYRYESATMLAQSIHLLRGTPYIYQGEEFAMTNPKFYDISEYNNIESINAYKDMLEKGIDKNTALRILNNKSRDNSRTPMQWDSENEYASFSNVKPWLS